MIASIKIHNNYIKSSMHKHDIIAIFGLLTAQSRENTWNYAKTSARGAIYGRKAFEVIIQSKFPFQYYLVHSSPQAEVFTLRNTKRKREKLNYLLMTYPHQKIKKYDYLFLCSIAARHRVCIY